MQELNLIHEVAIACDLWETGGSYEYGKDELHASVVENIPPGFVDRFRSFSIALLKIKRAQQAITSLRTCSALVPKLRHAFWNTPVDAFGSRFGASGPLRLG
jgi:hypothetical protein